MLKFINTFVIKQKRLRFPNSAKALEWQWKRYVRQNEYICVLNEYLRINYDTCELVYEIESLKA